RVLAGTLVAGPAAWRGSERSSNRTRGSWWRSWSAPWTTRTVGSGSRRSSWPGPIFTGNRSRPWSRSRQECHGTSHTALRKGSGKKGLAPAALDGDAGEIPQQLGVIKLLG